MDDGASHDVGRCRGEKLQAHIMPKAKVLRLEEGTI